MQKKKEQALLTYLKQQKVDQKLIDTPYVKIHIDWETEAKHSYVGYRLPSGQLIRRFFKCDNSEETSVCFIEMPAYPFLTRTKTTAGSF